MPGQSRRVEPAAGRASPVSCPVRQSQAQATFITRSARPLPPRAPFFIFAASFLARSGSRASAISAKPSPPRSSVADPHLATACNRRRVVLRPDSLNPFAVTLSQGKGPLAVSIAAAISGTSPERELVVAGTPQSVMCHDHEFTSIPIVGRA